MRKCCLILSPLSLVIAIAAGVIAFAVFPAFFKRKLANELTIKNNTEAWDRFVDFPIGVQWNIYFFEAKNFQNFNGNISELEFVEKGPYVYDEYWSKEIGKSDLSEDGTNVTYTMRKLYTFNPKLTRDAAKTSEQSYLKENNPNLENIDLINPLLSHVIFSNMAKSLIITDKIENFAFNGVGDILSQSIFTQSGKYVAEEDRLVVHTGKDDIEKLNTILEFVTPRDVWKKLDKGRDCNVPRGTDGTQFHPDVQPSDRLYAYEPMICREVSFTNRLKDQEIRGIQTLRFVAEPHNFLIRESGNECYCDQPDVKLCENDMLPLVNCGRSSGMDILASSPYFLYNEKLRNKIGLKAPKKINEENYATILEIEPITGTVVGARKRLQLNLRLKRTPGHPVLENLSEESVLVPLLWVEEGADLDVGNADILKTKVFGPKAAVTISLIVVMSVATVISILAAVISYLRR